MGFWSWKREKSVKKVDSTRHVATNCAKSGSGTKPRQKSGSLSLESELKLSRRPSPEAQPAPRVHSSSLDKNTIIVDCFVRGAQLRSDVNAANRKIVPIS